jgi:hypothetical protein
MKEIKPKQIWFNGAEYNATLFQYYGTFDNQTTQAQFYFAFYTGTIEYPELKLSSGNLYMDQPQYDEYNTSLNSSEYAKNWICSKLGVELI